MKNIHLLPTDKPTWLHKSTTTNILRKSSSCIDDMKQAQGMNIYITADEEIKKGDWLLTKNEKLIRCYNRLGEHIYYVSNSGTLGTSVKFCKKVILTTDTYLIKEGIQAVDNDLLEWFIKNPSCEYIKTEKWLDDEGRVLYSREVPQENYSELQKNSLELNKNFADNSSEQKLESIMKEFDKYEVEDVIMSLEKDLSLKEFDERVDKNREKLKQETLEEACDRIFVNCPGDMTKNHAKKKALELARWQADRSYSKEDMIAFAKFAKSYATPRDVEKAFENFKKK